MKKTRGFTCGAFDLLHPGHLYFFKKAKQKCDHLVIGLHTDPTIDRPDSKNKPCESTYERWLRLDSVKYVDEIIPYDTESDLWNLLQMLDLDFRFLGDDYKNKPFTGKELPINIEYISRDHAYSSSGLRKRITENERWRKEPT
tara:strand:- start:4469 stop:4897 length:429 start_codon:yes stop_codon:yes gene_type:complete